MAEKGHKSKGEIKTSGGSYTKIGGLKAAPFAISKDELDITEITDDAKNRILGLLDAPQSLSGTLITADAGQAILRAAFISEEDLTYKVSLDSVDYAELPVKVKSWKIDPNTGDAVQFTAEIVSVGMPVFL